MANQEKSAIASIKEFVDEIDLTLLVDLIEEVLKVIPHPAAQTVGLKFVGALKVANKFKPMASGALGTANAFCANFTAARNNRNLQIANSEQTSSDIAGANQLVGTDGKVDYSKIETLIEIAMEDGILTPEEEAFILSKTEKLGLDPDVVELKLMSLKKENADG